MVSARPLAVRARLGLLRLTWPGWAPTALVAVLDQLHSAVSPQTYLVGGTVRDLLLGRPNHDWDVAVAAEPGAVEAAFPRTLPTGVAHGTVTVLTDGLPVEVTSLRREGPYGDGRRPDYVELGASLAEDLARRDFTINAMAFGWPPLPPKRAGRTPRSVRSVRPVLFDPSGGLRDLEVGLVRAVGDARARFSEDHLRILRAYRIAAELGFELDLAIRGAAVATAPQLRRVSTERIRAELDRILVSEGAAWSLEELRIAGAVEVLLPELAAGHGFVQNEYHPLDVWYHSLAACDAIPPVLHLRLAALLHDVGKPATLTVDADGRRHFYGHETVGAGLAAALLERLRYDRATINRVVHLIDRHMDLHDLPPDASDAAVRRAAARVGRANISDLLHLREADRKASGKQGAVSAGTLALLARLRDLDRADAALAVRDLRIDGRQVMEITGLPQGPAVGQVLALLLDEVLEDPGLNNPGDLARLALRFAAQLSQGR